MMSSAVSLFSRRDILLLGGFLAVYVPFDWATFIPAAPGLNITPWNPPAGLYLALLLLLGGRAVPAVAVGLLLGDVLVRAAPASAGPLLAANAIILASYTATATVLRRSALFDPALPRLRDVALLVAAAFACAAVVAPAFVGVFAAAGIVSWSAAPLLALQYWLGDAIGVSVMTPAVLLLLQGARIKRPRLRELGQAIALAAALVVVLLPIGQGQFNLFYVLFLPLIWIAVSHGLKGAALATAALQIGLIAGLQVKGQPLDAIIYHQTLMLALVLTALFLGAAVNDRRRAEARLRDHQVQLAVMARLATTGEMASALAHELNQPLLASISYARACQRMLAQSGHDPARAADLIDKAVAQMERAGEVIRGLRTFLRNQPPTLEPVPVAAIVQEVLTLARADARYHGVDLRHEVAAALPPVLADKVQIEQVLLNLIRNSIESIASAATPRRVIVLRAQATDATAVEFSVEDSGPGVAADMVDNLYSPFASTKPAGMGLGLPICRSIAEAHGGHLRLDRSDDRGAVFTLHLKSTADPGDPQ